MDPFDDLRTVWQNLPQPAAPDGRAVAAAARRGRARLAGKLALALASLVATLLFLGWGLSAWDFAYATTKVGMVVVILAILAAVIVSSSLLRLLLGRVDSAADSRVYLRQLQRYQQRQKLVQTLGMRLYYLLLSGGMALYLFEFLMRSWWFGLIAYTLTGAWVVFSWVYLMPRAIRKQNQALDELIGQVERIAGQL